MKKFWKWKNQAPQTDTGAGIPAERVLELYGTIAEESWYDDNVTPKMFKDELISGEGPVTVWINSPGGDCVAASQIYAMLMDYKGEVTVKIDGLAASAASVIAMAGSKVLMASTALMMIHNPITAAFGDSEDMQKAIEMLSEVKESIINAYELKTGMSRNKLSKLMDAETWMNAKKAMEYGFADGILTDESKAEDIPAYAFSGKTANTELYNKVIAKTNAKANVTAKAETAKATADANTKAHIAKAEEKHGRHVDELTERLNLLKY